MMQSYLWIWMPLKLQTWHTCNKPHCCWCLSPSHRCNHWLKAGRRSSRHDPPSPRCRHMTCRRRSVKESRQHIPSSWIHCISHSQHSSSCLQGSKSRCKNFLRISWLVTAQLSKRWIWSYSWKSRSVSQGLECVPGVQSCEKPLQSILGKDWTKHDQNMIKHIYNMFVAEVAARIFLETWYLGHPVIPMKTLRSTMDPWNMAVWLAIEGTKGALSCWMWPNSFLMPSLMASSIASKKFWSRDVLGSRLVLRWSNALWPSTACGKKSTDTNDYKCSTKCCTIMVLAWIILLLLQIERTRTATSTAAQQQYSKCSKMIEQSRLNTRLETLQLFLTGGLRAIFAKYDTWRP